jgi:hypothetical protein
MLFLGKADSLKLFQWASPQKGPVADFKRDQRGRKGASTVPVPDDGKGL